MFRKKSCKRCGKGIKKGFSYCPFCGSDTRDRQKEQKDYGFLGRDDREEIIAPEPQLPFGINFIFKNLMKEMDKQFRELDREIGREMREKKEMEKRVETKKIQNPMIKQGGISINISQDGGTPIIRVKSMGNIPEFKEIEKELGGLSEELSEDNEEQKPRRTKISEEKARKFSKLPRQEAESKVRKLSGKIVYEIELPGVKSLKDVVVNELENSIEIKAFAKDKAYFKFLPFALPLLRYKLQKERLILELEDRE